MGVRVPTEPEPASEPERRPFHAPAAFTAAFVGVSLLAVLLANGRPIGAGDTRATEYAAASLVQQGNLDLDEYPEVTPPFARTVKGRDGSEHRVSVYPVLSAVVAAPVFALVRAAVALDETGSALAGKLAAALFAATAAALFFVAVGARRLEREALLAAVVFALGTSVWSTSQALWQHPLAVLFLCLALLGMIRADRDPAWAGRIALPLGLALAARHADVALVAVLAVAVVVRWPRSLPSFVLWSLPPVLFVLGYDAYVFGSPWQHGFSGMTGRFTAPWGQGHLGLLVSPAKGLLVFTPAAAVAALGLVRAFRRGDRWLATTLGLAVLAHLLLVGRWAEWHGGTSWGPRLMTDALPLLFLFLPEGLEVARPLGLLLGAVSIGVQALGAFSYDYRWERLHQQDGVLTSAALWDVADSPIPFYLARRVVLFAVPGLRDGRAVVREHPVVLFSSRGSRVEFQEERPSVIGTDETLEDAHLQRGARVENGRLRLRGRWDGVFVRVTPPARGRRLELRVAGTGRGVLYVGERSFWSDAPRWTTHTISGPFLLRQPYFFPESGGPDLTVTVGLGGGTGELAWVALVPPGEPLQVLRAPGEGR
jgi:hypothetical protein